MKPAAAAKVTMFAERNSRRANSCSRSRGAGTRRSTTTNAPSISAPTTPGIQMMGESHPCAAPSETANMNAANPKEASSRPGTSSAARVFFAIFGTRSRVNTTAKMPMGTLIPKIHRQLASWTSTPPSTGPRAGARAIGIVMIRLSRTRSAGGKLRYSMAMPTGVMSPPPTPCTMR